MLSLYQKTPIDESLLDNYDVTETQREFAPIASHEEAAKDDRVKSALSPLYQIPDGLAALKDHLSKTDRKIALNMIKRLKDVQNSCDYAEEHYEKYISDSKSLSLALSQVSSALSTMSTLSNGVVETTLDPPPIRSMPGVSLDIPPYDPSLMLEAVNLLQMKLDDLRSSFNELAERTENLSSLTSEADLITLHCSIEAAKVGDDAKDFSSGVISRISDLSHKIADLNDSLSAGLSELDSGLLSVNSAVSALQAAENEAVRFSENSDKALSDCSRAISARDNVINEYLQYAEKALEAVETSDRSIRAIGERSGKICQIVDECHDSAANLEAELTGSRADLSRIKNDLRQTAQIVKESGEESRLSSMDKFIRDSSRLINKVISSIR